MAVEQYSLVANDWLNLEFIINDLTQRVIGQELAPGSSPTFVDLTLSGLTENSVVFVGAGSVLSENNPNFNWNDALSRLDVTDTLRVKDSSGNVIFYVDDNEMYFTSSAIAIADGMCIGLLLALTYKT